jgi:RNA polymerase-binding transcription factor DksA
MNDRGKPRQFNDSIGHGGPRPPPKKIEKGNKLKPTKKTSTNQKTAKNAEAPNAPKGAKKTTGATREASSTTKLTQSEMAKKLLQNKMAKKKTTARVKPSRPIAFTLDEAIEVAKAKANQTADKASAAHGTPPAPTRENSKKEITDDVKQETRVLGAASLSDILGYNPAAGPKKENADDIPPKFIRYYKLLLELREHVVSGLDIHTRDTLKRSAKDDSGDLSAYSQHMADAGTDTFDRDFALSLVSSEQDALFEIEDAIRRIRNGNYGICEITGKPIKKERLLAVPFAKYSVEGQAEYERTNRKSAYRGGAFGDTPEDAAQFMDDDSDE